MAIEYLSVVSLFIEMYFDGGESRIGIGTAFTVKKNEKHYLITNWHCLTGIDPISNKPLNENGLCNPDILKVWFCGEKIGTWIPKSINLLDENGNHKWIEHPEGKNVDVVALPLDEQYNDVKIYPMDLELAHTQLKIYPSKAVSIIGFPKGISSSGKFPIWKKGHIASDFDVNYNNQPVFLIDATTKSGMSGSPVVLKESGICEFENEAIANGTYIRFLGVYAGRIDKDIEIGRVWKACVIDDIFM